MSRKSTGDEPITSRAAFERALRDLLVAARTNDVQVRGPYETQRGRDGALHVDISEEPSTSRRQGSLRPRARPADGGASAVTTRASLVQVLTGTRLAADGGSAVCARCGAGVVDGESITAIATSPIEGFQWTIRELFCEACHVSELPSQAVGRTDALVGATVSEALNASKQCGWQLASDVTILEYSPPSEGSACR